MPKNQHTWKYKTATYLLPLVIGLLYFVLTDLSLSKTQSSSPASLLVLLTIMIPVIIIWLIATTGAVSLKNYADSIRDSKDGDSLNDIANALLWLLGYIYLLPMVHVFAGLFLHTRYLNLAVDLGNFVPLAIALESGYLLFRGSRKLVGITHHKIESSDWLIVFSVLAGAFFAGFAGRFYQTVPRLLHATGVPTFALPVPVLLIAYVIPYLVLWTIGILACRNLAHYAGKVKGKLYRALFSDLYRGILLVYICLFGAQVLIISSIQLSGINAGEFVVYGLMLLATSGFLLVARGAQKLAVSKTDSVYKDVYWLIKNCGINDQ